MKRSLLVFGVVTSLSLVPTIARAVPISASPEPSVSASPTTARHLGASTQKAAQDAAHAVYLAALTQAHNGRDLAFADANANLLQSLQVAGKDKVARLAARAAYKDSAIGIATAFKQAIQTAISNYKTALAALKGH
jgi:hypothetical protein